jgi:DNA-binding CsgD family transcriptional regulator
VLAASPPGPSRARLLWRLGAVKAAVAGPPAAYPLYLQALDEAGDDHRLAAQIHDRLATWRWIGEGARAAEPHARALVELAEEVAGPALLARALGALLALELAQGRGLDRVRYERMIALERESSEHGIELPGSTLHHQLLTWAGAYDESRERVEEFLERARERGDAAQILPLWCLGYVDLVSAEWHGTLDATAKGLELVEQVGRTALVPGYVTLRALALAHLGDVEGATAEAQRGIALAGRSGQEIHALLGHVALGLLDLARGDTWTARARYADVAEAMERRGDSGLGEWWLPDEIEARVAEGDVDEAARRLAPYEGESARSALPRFLAASARCRALIAHARGDADAASAEFDAALGYHDEFADAYQLGRTLLALGSMQRRLNRKALAAETLARAAEQFDAVGAALWAERALVEQARIGGRRAATADLTPTEGRIAELVRAGRTNAEIGRTLSISPRTVEWNLTKVYRKLRVSSRAELAAKLAEHR